MCFFYTLGRENIFLKFWGFKNLHNGFFNSQLFLKKRWGFRCGVDPPFLKKKNFFLWGADLRKLQKNIFLFFLFFFLFPSSLFFPFLFVGFLEERGGILTSFFFFFGGPPQGGEGNILDGGKIFFFFFQTPGPNGGTPQKTLFFYNGFKKTLYLGETFF